MKVTLLSKTQPNIDNLNIEEFIIYCARVSSSNRDDTATAGKLMKYLLEHKHMSPFEMASFSFEVETSRAIAQQLLRHRSFSFQEFSQRYAKVVASEEVELRVQADTNRQSSTKVLSDPHLRYVANTAIKTAQDAYTELLSKGVSRETARMVLPLTTRTTVVMHGTVRSWIHFLEQRCSEHAQKEIQDIANEIKAQLTIELPNLAGAIWTN